MGARWSAFRDFYLTVDRRVLGALRIATGLVYPAPHATLGHVRARGADA